MNEVKQQLLTKMGDTSERVKRIQQQVNFKKQKNLKKIRNDGRTMEYS